MKLYKILFLILSTMGFIANAEVIISNKTVHLNIDISTAKLKLSRSDYSSPVVKVLVPELADVTLLDHRNTGEGAPCLATYQTLSPEEVIQNNPSTELTPVTITLKKHVFLDSQNQTCHVSLEEFVETDIRGFKFEHIRNLDVGTRHIDDCR